MFGYACRETPELMPLPIMLAHRLVRGMSDLRRSGAVDYLRPDGKSQVTVEYDGDKPVRIDAIVLSTQHSPDVTQETIRKDLTERVIAPIIPAAMIKARVPDSIRFSSTRVRTRAAAVRSLQCDH